MSRVISGTAIAGVRAPHRVSADTVSEIRRAAAPASPRHGFSAFSNTFCGTPLLLDVSATRRAPWMRSKSAIPSIVAAVAGGGSEVIDVEPLPSEARRFKGLKVLVAGASGGCGKLIVEQLIAKGVQVRAMVRDTSTAPSFGPGVEVVVGDVFKYETLSAALGDANCIICATGSRPSLDPLGPFSVDYTGTLNLVAAAKKKNIERFVYITSIGADDILFPLNLFWGVLFWKKRAEEELQRSGITYTIVRPGGLKNELQAGESRGNIIMERGGTFGLPPKRSPGGVLRDQVAEVCVEALVEDAAMDKTVEVIAEAGAPVMTLAELFEGV